MMSASSFLADVCKLKAEVAYLFQCQLFDDSAECINVLARFCTEILVDHLGQNLQNISVDEKRMLLRGPFSRRRNLCEAYLDLIQHQFRHPNPEFEEYLCSVEGKVVHKFNDILEFPKQPDALRKLFLAFVNKGRALRNPPSVLGLLTQVEQENALRRIESNLGILKKYGLESLTPLVSAGIYILRHAVTGRNVEDDLTDEGDLEEDLSSTSSKKGCNIIQSKQRTVKVTFVARKKLKLGYAVSIFGYHSVLGKGLPDHAVHMSCEDGDNWSKVFKFSVGESIQYSFVIMKQQKESKWVMVDGPIGDFTVYVGPSAMIVETNLEDFECGEDGIE